ncbi:uncharacterized protein LOC124530687 [Vanessa cardui]|uniref:uncharacterized protein LOC124530687 n=1 Tax=Vanessa cardui TaxID=171605 RepID=UPI001F12DEC2|nr:uncharacterized protein LOC124530687 [Vanessa cardui]
MVLFIIFNIIIYTHLIFGLNETFNYEKLHKFGLGRPIIYRRRNYNYEYPEELVTKRPDYIRSPYRNVYQGASPNKGDRRVYNKRFQYKPQVMGHKIICKGVFDCPLTHIAVETNGSIPIIFRGGVGYKYFTIIIRADAGDELSGRVRAFCARLIGDNTTEK